VKLMPFLPAKSNRNAGSSGPGDSQVTTGEVGDRGHDVLPGSALGLC
jgi:hypothetical protein